MKIRQTIGQVHVDLSGAEARALLDELSDVRGGARLPKIRQLCRELEMSFASHSGELYKRKKTAPCGP